MKLGVIGAGNMAGAIVRGVIASKKIAASDIYVSDKDSSKLDKIKQTGVNTSIENGEVIKNSEVIIFAVKPNVYPYVLSQAAEVDGIDKKLIISIAPGITTESMEKCFSSQVRIVRTMPNTPALVGEGMSVICAGKYATQDDIKCVEEIFGCVGKVAVLDESMMNAVVAISSSSPAYVFMMIEAMADAGVRSGLGRDISYYLASQAVCGAAKLAASTDYHVAELKDMVCSPAGTTIEAVAVLERLGFRSALIEAMDACTKKTEAMGKS